VARRPAPPVAFGGVCARCGSARRASLTASHGGSDEPPGTRAPSPNIAIRQSTAGPASRKRFVAEAEPSICSHWRPCPDCWRIWTALRECSGDCLSRESSGCEQMPESRWRSLSAHLHCMFLTIIRAGLCISICNRLHSVCLCLRCSCMPVNLVSLAKLPASHRRLWWHFWRS